MKYSLLVSLLLLGLLFNCSKKEFGKYIKVDNRTSVEFLKRYPKNYLNKFVMIKGRVVEESPKGLWINVQDGNFTVSANFGDNGIILNSMISNTVTIVGRFIQTKDGYMISGKYLKRE